MTVVPPQQVQLKCPNCGQPFRTAIYSMIDVGQQPVLKTALLSGQLNVAVCPSCGAGSLIGAPLVYHDPTKQLFLAYIPQEMNLKPEDQERFIGDMAGFAMQGLPAETPRGYLLTARRFMSLQSLLDAVLEADGISREMIDAQRRRVALIGRLAEVLEDEPRFAQLVEENRQQIDYDLLALLGAYIEASNREGRDESTQMLVVLRDRLIELTGLDASGDEGSAGEAAVDLEQLVDQAIAADESELAMLLAEARAEIDYSFFERLTDRIEQARLDGDTQEAERLTARRQRILETVEQMDREAQQVFERATRILREVFAAADPEAALRERRDQIDEAFMLVLDANEAAAARGGNELVANDIARIRQLAMQVVEEALTPEERLINQLLTTETPQDATKLLRKNAAQVTSSFVKRLNDLADQLDTSGRKNDSETVRRLAREAGAMLF